MSVVQGHVPLVDSDGSSSSDEESVQVVNDEGDLHLDDAPRRPLRLPHSSTQQPQRERRLPHRQLASPAASNIGSRHSVYSAAADSQFSLLYAANAEDSQVLQHDAAPGPTLQRHQSVGSDVPVPASRRSGVALVHALHMHGANAASDKGAWKAAYVKETPRRVPAGVLKTTAPGQRPAATPAAATPAVATPASAWSAASATAKAAASSHTLNPAPAGHQRLRVANHGLLPYSYGMCSLRGTAAYDRSKPNLDRGVAVENLGNERHQAFFAVLDGHGAQGAAATAFVASTYPAAIIASPHWRSSTQRGAKSAAALVEAAHVTNEALLAVPDLDMSLSGTTCCAVLLRGTRLYVANVGHSRVVLARHVARVAKPGGLVLSHPSVADLPPVLAAVMRFTDLPPSACHVIDHLKAQSTRNAKRMKGIALARTLSKKKMASFRSASYRSMATSARFSAHSLLDAVTPGAGGALGFGNTKQVSPVAEEASEPEPVVHTKVVRSPTGNAVIVAPRMLASPKDGVLKPWEAASVASPDMARTKSPDTSPTAKRLASLAQSSSQDDTVYMPTGLHPWVPPSVRPTEPQQWNLKRIASEKSMVRVRAAKLHAPGQSGRSMSRLTRKMSASFSNHMNSHYPVHSPGEDAHQVQESSQAPAVLQHMLRRPATAQPARVEYSPAARSLSRNQRGASSRSLRSARPETAPAARRHPAALGMGTATSSGTAQASARTRSKAQPRRRPTTARARMSPHALKAAQRRPSARQQGQQRRRPTSASQHRRGIRKSPSARATSAGPGRGPKLRRPATAPSLTTAQPLKPSWLKKGSGKFKSLRIDTGSGPADKARSAEHDRRRELLTRAAYDVIPIPLSLDQKPDRPDEKTRLAFVGAVLQPYLNSLGQRVGGLRVWLPDQFMPGLPLSRSFGDAVAKTVGVSATPEVVQHSLTQEDRFLIIASDGVWQVMSSQAAVNTVEQALQLAWFPEASGLTRHAADDGPTRTRQQSRALRAMQQHTHHGKALAPGCQVKAGSGATPTVVELFGRTGAQLSGHVRSNAALGRKARAVSEVAMEAAKALVSCARELWLKRGDSFVDDITATVVVLNQ